MALLKASDIKTISYVHVGDSLVEVKDLSVEEKEMVAAWIGCTLANTLFAGEYYTAPADPALARKIGLEPVEEHHGKTVL